MKDFKKSQHPNRLPFDGKIVVPHQPQFMPWIGFFNKASMGDIYLIHDVDQYKKETFENRNKIRLKNKEGWDWITVPVSSPNKSKHIPIAEMRFAQPNWKRKALKKIELSYGRAPFFKEYFPKIVEIYDFETQSLLEFNVNAIKAFFKILDINIPVYRSSEMIAKGHKLEGQSTDAVVSMASWFEADVLVAGVMGKTYLEVEKFEEANCKLVFQDFKHPTYNQHHGEFLPYMSIVDLLFNEGEAAKGLIGEPNYEVA
jgi:hypothetical protein